MKNLKSNPVRGKAVPVLLVTDLEFETQEALSFVKDRFHNAIRQVYLGSCITYDVGEIGSNHVFLLQSGFRGVDSAAKILSVSTCIEAITPSAIIAIGLGGGVDSYSQELGDILLGSKVIALEEKQTMIDSDRKSNVYLDGSVLTAPPHMLHLFISHTKDWQKSRIHTGVLVSGRILLSHPSLAEKIRELDRDIVGITLDSSTQMAAMYHGIDWISIRAISDLMDTFKKYRSDNIKDIQHTSMDNLLHFVFQVLEQAKL